MPTMFTKAEFAQLEEIAAEAVRTSQPIPSSPDYDATAVRPWRALLRGAMCLASKRCG